MWSVGKYVDKYVVQNVNSRYPQKVIVFDEVIHSPYPQMFFSVYSDLGDLLGFPRPYYYY
jgi:hypothetical protein